MAVLVDSVSVASNLLKEANYPVAFTGAGISTLSGIPDWRSPGGGMWEQVSSMPAASMWAFRMRSVARPILEVEPNVAHRALADLWAAGRLRTVITQNTEALHQAAASQHVLELHGHTRKASHLDRERSVEAGADLIILNLQPTSLESHASVVIRCDVVATLPVIAGRCLRAPWSL